MYAVISEATCPFSKIIVALGSPYIEEEYRLYFKKYVIEFKKLFV